MRCGVCGYNYAYLNWNAHFMSNDVFSGYGHAYYCSLGNKMRERWRKKKKRKEEW